MLRAAAILLACVSLPSLTQVLARDIYVDNIRGDDRWDGSERARRDGRQGPCRSIRRALEMAVKGDRIILAKTQEPYRESITLQAGRHSGREGKPFQIIGNGAILDGTRPMPVGTWEHHAGEVFRFTPKGKRHQLLYLGDQPAVRKIVEPNGPLPSLQPLEWSLYEGVIYFRTEPGKLPGSYDLRYTFLPVGITLYEVRHVAITDLIIQGFRLDGVNAHDSVFGGQLVGLTARGNGRAGISIGGASRVELVACLVGDNGTAQVRTEGFSVTQLRNCRLLENSAPAVVQQGGRIIRHNR